MWLASKTNKQYIGYHTTVKLTLLGLAKPPRDKESSTQISFTTAKATRRGNGHGKTLHVRLKNLQACPFANSLKDARLPGPVFTCGVAVARHCVYVD